MVRGIGLSASVTAASCLLWTSCVQAPPVFVGQNGERVEIRAGRTRVLTRGLENIDEWPSPSPDGSTIVFARYDTAMTQRVRLWIIGADGSNLRRVNAPDLPYDYTRPSWSRDGKWIAFSASTNEHREYANTGIWIMNVATGETRSVSDPARYTDIYAQWLPDGRGLIVMRAVQGDVNRDLWRLRLDGSAMRITDNPGFDGKPSVSPDGRFVVFPSERPAGSPRRLWVMDLAAGDRSARAETTGPGRSPAWSRDGRWIAFVANVGGSSTLYIKRPGVSKIIQVSPRGMTAENPEWLPSSDAIVFATGKPLRLAIVDVSHVTRR